MSRTWQRSAVDTLCSGRCNHTVIRRGDPVQFISLPGVTRTLTRCRHCAEGDVPPNLPAEIVNKAEPIVPSMPARFSVTDIPFDYKRAAGGDD